MISHLLAYQTSKQSLRWRCFELRPSHPPLQVLPLSVEAMATANVIGEVDGKLSA